MWHVIRPDPHERPSLDWRPEWDPTGGTGSEGDEDNDRKYAETRLYSKFDWFGTSFHVDAIEVRREDGCLEAVNPDFESTINEMAEISGDGNFETTFIDGREYVIVIYPWST